MNREWREGDIVVWWFTEKELKRRNHGNNGGTTYWSASQIAVFEDGRFWDTYWVSNHYNKNFTPESIGDTHKVKFIANFDELDKIDYSSCEYLSKMYDESDIVNLNHANSSRGNLYLRKGAKKKINIIKESYERKIAELKSKIDHWKWTLEQTEKEFENLTEDNFEESKVWI